MQIVHIYDIAGKSWFAQSTTAQGGSYPGGRGGFCSVVASAEDDSSHNIYIYGGSMYGDDSNEVFILTLPAFHWVSVYPPTNNSDALILQGNGHRCQKVHEKYMVAYGGQYTCQNETQSKRINGMVIYDMSSLTWTTKVEIGNQKYSVPQALYEIIGGK